MNRRHILLCLLPLVSCILFPVSAATPRKTYPVDSPVHRALEYLYVTQEMALPSTAGPWSGDELALMLSGIDEHRLDPSERETYRFVAGQLAETLPLSSFSGSLALEAYLHTNTDTFTENEDWYYDWERRSPLLTVPFELSVADRFYGLTDFEVGNMKYTDSEDQVTGLSDLYGTYAVTTNGYNFWMEEPFAFDVNAPYRAFASFGGAGWNLEVGRDRLSWGPGTTGNFLLGDQVQYHNMALFTAYGDTFKYTFLTSFFPTPEEIWQENPTQASAIWGGKMFMAHRFEWRLFSGRVGLALNEGIMYQSTDSQPDLRVINPMMFYHNYFIRSNANSIASLELDVAPARYWNLYAQLVVDEYSFGSTERSLDDERKHPNAVGLMFGAKTVRPIGGGMFYANLEGAYTDPYLYLRSVDGDATQGAETDALNFVTAVRRWYSEGLVYDQSYLGYRYGGDAIVGNLVAGFVKFGDWSIEGRFLALIHGEKGMDSPWTLGDLALAPSGAVTSTFDLGVSGEKELSGPWKIWGAIDLMAIDSAVDLQLCMGMGYSIR